MITGVFLIILAINGSHWDELQPWTTTFKILVGAVAADFLFQMYLADQAEKLRQRIFGRQNEEFSATTE